MSFSHYSSSLDFFCHYSLCNKSQRLPFGESSLESRGPLDLVYTDVWGSSPIQSIDDFNYYVVFVDPFTKYIWFYPLRLKFDVFTIFRQYKVVVEKNFNRSTISVYSNGGGEYTALKDFLSTWVFNI